MPLYWKVSATLWLSSKNSAAAYRGHGEFLSCELLNLNVWVLFTKTLAQSRSIWLLFTLHSFFPEIKSTDFRCRSSTLDVPSFCPCAHRLTLPKSTWLTRGTYQLKLAFPPTAEPHPWLSFHMCWHKLLHPRSRPAAPSHPCLGGWWLHEVGYYSGSTETEEEAFLMLQSLC